MARRPKRADPVVETAPAGDAEPGTDAEPQPRKTIYVNSTQIAAAKLQITLDRKLGRETLDIVKMIAAAK